MLRLRNDRVDRRLLVSVLEQVHLTVLLALAFLVWLVPDGPIAWRSWCVGLLAVGAAAALCMQAASPGRPWASARWWAPAVPYVLYAAAWLASYLYHPSAAGWRELTDQIVFLAVVGCAAQVRHPARLLAIVLTILCLIGLQVLGPASLVIGIGRATHYKSLDQWSGYPEIGMLTSLGSMACLAIVFATYRFALVAAAGLLALGLAGTTAYMLSRSAMLTIAVVVPLLALAASVRVRSRLALATLAIVIAGGGVFAARAGTAGWERLGAATHMKGQEMDQRLEGWRVAMAMLRDHPWLGVGPGRYAEEHARYSATPDTTHAYNIVLHTGAELGLGGLVAYLAIWARLLVRTLKAVGPTTTGFTAFAAHAMMLVFFIRSQSEHFLANLPTSFRMLLVLGFVFGLAEAAIRRTAADRADPRRAT
jgi:O-antigen ligase